MTGKIETLVGDKVFKLGSQGPVVQAMQLRLRTLGWALRGTGYWAAATDTAVREFQKRAGLRNDGHLGRKTAQAMDLGDVIVKITDIAEVARPIWLQAAIALVGTREFARGDNPTIIDWAKDEGGAIAKDYTHDSIPWCALFANHVLTKSSLPGTETLWALDFAGKWPAQNLGVPVVGAFAPMVRNGGGHITIVVGQDQHGNIMGVGGNQSDAVTVVPFARSRLNKGFWWPDSVGNPPINRPLPVVRSDGRISSNEA